MARQAPQNNNDAALRRPCVGESSRVYAIGDIHGRHDLMMDLLAKIVEDAASFADHRRARVVFLGDYIDRGDHGRLVIDALLSVGLQEPKQGITALRGNHEDALLDFLESPISGRDWLDFGARQTLADYGVRQPSAAPSSDELMEIRGALLDAMGPHVSILRGLECILRDGDVIFTHAGLDPNDAETLCNTRAMVWGHPASLSPSPVPGKLLVHGHYDNTEPVDFPGRICVDTGAYYTGILTAVRLDQSVAFLTVGGG